MTKFVSIRKAYIEGIYSDTPQNRKLGRVGMTYKEWEEYKTPKKDKKGISLEDLSESSREKFEEVKKGNKSLMSFINEVFYENDFDLDEVIPFISDHFFSRFDVFGKGKKMDLMETWIITNTLIINILKINIFLKILQIKEIKN